MSQSTGPNSFHTALSAAQECHHLLRVSADRLRRQNAWRQGGLFTLAIAATILASLPCVVQAVPQAVVHSERLLWVGQISLVLVSLAFAGLMSRSSGWPDDPDEQTLTAGAAAIERALYLYRTVLHHKPDRDLWLNHQLARIQQQVQPQVQHALGAPSARSLPALVDAAPDLFAEDYLEQRLFLKLDAAAQKVAEHSAVRRWYQTLSVLLAGGVVLLPILSPNRWVWGAIAPLLGLTLLAWLKQSSLIRWIERYSQLVLGLTLLRDYWTSLPLAQHTEDAFARLVIATETLIESPHRLVSTQIQDAMTMLKGAELDGVLWNLDLERSPSEPDPTESVEATPMTAVKLVPEVQEEASEEESPTDTAAETPPDAPADGSSHPVTPAGTNGKPPTPAQSASLTPTSTPTSSSVKRGCPHAFVVMPFGRKQASDGRWIDFNHIYSDLIKPALETAGFEPFRADEEDVSGDILTDMFQELLLADLVVADLSIDNANVFYELGIRHALRRRGVVHIQAGRSYMPFDIFNVRTLPYHCDEQTGCPDPHFLQKDRQALVKMIQATWASERNRVHSPIFNLLTGLSEPERKALRTPLAVGYWQEYTTLQSRIAIAQRQKRIGDVVLLAEEVYNPLIKEDILAEAGKALKTMGNSALALKQYRQGLSINPENMTFRCEEAYHLSRLGQSDEAIVKLENLLQDIPACVDAITYLARIYKDLWKQSWIAIEDEGERIRVAYEVSSLLQKSIENYLRGYRLDQNQYYPGINALSLIALLDHLVRLANIDSGDVDEAAYRSKLSALKGSIQFCLESALQKAPNDYWAALSLGDLAVCVAESPSHVSTAYRKALAILWNNKFALQATLDQLLMMKGLNFRPDHVQAGISVLQIELERLRRQELLFAPSDEETDQTKPPQAFLFTGHMIDRPNRPKPRFPAGMEPEASAKIEEVLNRLNAYSNCVAIAPGLACGGDILFVEACLKRNMQVEIYMPFEPSEFIQRSVSFAGDRWVERFYAILNNSNITLHLQPDRLGPVPAEDNPFGRNNRWALYSTLMHDISRVRLIALWNGQGGDGPGGTADMVHQVRQLGGIVEHIDTNKFDYWQHPDQNMEQIFHKLETLP